MSRCSKTHQTPLNTNDLVGHFCPTNALVNFGITNDLALAITLAVDSALLLVIAFFSSSSGSLFNSSLCLVYMLSHTLAPALALAQCLH